MKLAAYGNYLKVKRALRDAFSQAMTSSTDDNEKEARMYLSKKKLLGFFID